MKHVTIENSLKGQINVLKSVRELVDNYLVEFQEIDKELKEDVYTTVNGSYNYAIRYDKVLVDELSKKLGKNLKKMRSLKKKAEKDALGSYGFQAWDAPLFGV